MITDEQIIEAMRETAKNIHRRIASRSCGVDGTECSDQMSRCYCLDEIRFVEAELRTAFAVAKPLIREQALREAAGIVRSVPANPRFDLENALVTRVCGFAANAIDASISALKAEIDANG